MILIVEGFTVVVTAATVAQIPIRPGDWLIVSMLALCSVLHLELVLGVERIREGTRANTPHTDLKSVWNFAAVLILPPALAVALVVLTSAHLRIRISRMQTFRWLYTTMTIVLATDASATVLHAGLHAGTYPGLPNSWQGVLIIVISAAMRYFVNFALIVGIILLSDPKTNAQDVISGASNSHLVETAALCLGAVVALVTIRDPWFLIIVMPPLLVLHRSQLVRHYELAARTDPKTGLTNATHWSQVARSELARAERDRTSVGVLMIDLDHFKRINDNYGHLTGDAVLQAVADALKREAREYDVVGRFGGEEFMILLPGANPNDLPTVAERFRHCVGGLVINSPDNQQPVTVTASAGAVTYPDGGNDLDELLLAADAALYRAKERGRNQTCLAPPMSNLPTARRPEE
jgi:diguanylate cyclase (GGDEF)-like protein